MIKHLYVHVPFCKNICYYCDFCHRIYNNELSTKWLSTLNKEISNKCKDQYETIYIGGGTPNSLSIDELDTLFSYIKPYSNNVKEYTIELNPETFTIEQIDLFKKYNINRFSIGLQSSNDRLLEMMNRKHTFEDVKNLVNILKANGFINISIDIMYSLPTQTMDDLKKTIDDFISLDIPHISIYSLTIEENSVFNKKGFNKLDDETEGLMYEFIQDYLTKHDYIQYEVSNFSKKGYESKHNIGYWLYDNYLGVSLSSTSKINNNRYTNTSNFDLYFESYDNKDEDLVLSNKDLIIENLMMSLRTNIGINISDFNNKYNIDFMSIFKNSINRFSNELVIDDGYIRCNKLGILNHILTYFYLDLDSYFDE